MKERRFTNVTGFGCGSQYVSFYEDGRNTITTKEGEEKPLGGWQIEDALNHVRMGVWKELPSKYRYVKIRVANAAQSEAAQKLLAEMGYSWHEEELGTALHTNKCFLYGDKDGCLGYGSTEEYFKACRAVELKLNEVVTYAFEEVPRKTVQIDGRTYFEDEVLQRLGDLAEVV